MNLSATKKLMRALRAKGVEIKRGPRAGLFEDALGGKRIPVIEIPKKSSIGVLWHEAGHHVARRAATVNEGKVAAARQVLREQGVTGKAHDTAELVGRLRRERNANRAALKVMGRMKVPPEMQQKFKKVATKGYGTYRGQRYVKEVVPAAELRKKAWEFAAELTPTGRAVWRHYYRKIKKATRSGKLSGRLDGYLPGDSNASKGGLLWRGTHKGEVEALASSKRFKSKWTHDTLPGKPRTYVAGSAHKTVGYAQTAAAHQGNRGSLNAARSIFGTTPTAAQVGDARMYAIAPTALRRSDNKLRGLVGDYAGTAPIKGGIARSEVRALLKPNGAVASQNRRGERRIRMKWRPATLGEIERHEFGAFAEALRAVRRAKKDIGKGVKLTRVDQKWPLITPEPSRWRRATFSPDSARPTVWQVNAKTGKRTPQTPASGTINIPRKSVSIDGPVASYLHEAGHAKLRHGRRIGHQGESLLSSSGNAGSPSHWRGVLAQERGASKEAVKWSGGLKPQVQKNLRKGFNTYRKRAMAEMYGIGAPGTKLSHVREALQRHPWLRGYGFDRIDSRRVEMSGVIGYEGGVPLTGKVARDRWVKKLRDEDLDRRDANLGRAGAAGAVAGAMIPSRKLGLYRRMGIGAVAGTLGVLAVRRATAHTKDPYGERSRAAKRAEVVPAVAGLTVAGVQAARKLGLLKKIKLQSANRRVIELAKKDERKRGLNPYVGAAASGAVSGAGLGFLPMILRRGTSLKAALKAGAVGGLASGAIVGGGALLGSKIVGKPREDEGAAFTKRAAIGGTIAGAGVGLAGGLALRKTRGGARMLVKASKQWRPAMWMRQGRGHGGLASAAAIGAVGGGVYGGATGADEGQQVDSIRHLRKDLRQDVKRAAHRLSSRPAHIVFFDERRKDWRDARRESRGAAWRDAGMGTGALLAGAGVGAGAGYAGFRVGRAAKETQAVAGRVNGAMNAAVSGKRRIVRASQWMKRQLTTFPTFKKFKMQSQVSSVQFSAGGVPQKKAAKPMRHVREVIADMNRRPPSWNKGAANKVKNLLRWLAMEARAAGVHEFRELTPEQEQMRRRALVTGGVALPVGAVGYAGFRSLREARRMREAAGIYGPDHEIGKQRQRLGRELRENRRIAMKPLAEATPTMRKTTRERLAKARNLQQQAGVGGVGVLSRGERKAAAATLAKLRKAFRFARRGALVAFDYQARNTRSGQFAGYKDWVRNAPIVDKGGQPTEWTAPMVVHAVSREGQKVAKYSRRTYGLVKDVKEVAKGEKTKRREWDKAYFRNAVATAVGAGALLGHAVVYKGGKRPFAPKWARTYSRTVDKGIERYRDLRDAAEKRASRAMGLAARVRRLIAFDYYDPAQMHGWDMRDVRGRSARVFAPGARKRMRREAKWHEKKSGQRNILAGLAVAGTIAGAGGGVLIGRRLGQAAKLRAKAGIWRGHEKRAASNIIHPNIWGTNAAS